MPVAHCIISEELRITRETVNALARDWADSAGVSDSDVNLQFVRRAAQAGREYAVSVNLYLPSLWSGKEVRRIQDELLKGLVKYFKIPVSEVFIMTTILQPGHVIEDGEAVIWKESGA